MIPKIKKGIRCLIACIRSKLLGKIIKIFFIFDISCYFIFKYKCSF